MAMNSNVFKWAMGAVLLATVGCASDDADKSNFLGAPNDSNNSSGNNTTNNSSGVDGNNSTNNVFVPEIEEEYDFSAPAVVGDRVFVANETLNSVAVIDSSTLRVQNIPVGYRPTSIVGPTNSAVGNVWVLNEGSSTVTRIDSATSKTQTFRSLRRGNALAVSPDAKWAFAWFDFARFEGPIPAEIDLASITVLSESGAYQVAVGFNVREVRLSQDGKYALALTDDGISRIDLENLTGDALVPPIKLIDAAPEDLEVVVDPSGRWAVARASTQSALSLVDLESGEKITVNLPEIPTDLDWVAGGKVIVSLPRTGNHFIATVPVGLQNLALALAVVEPVEPPVLDAGMDDAGTGSDMGLDDVGFDLSDAGTDMEDAGSDMEDAGSDMQDAGADVDLPVIEIPEVEGVTRLGIEVSTLGAAEVAPLGNVVLFFSTLNDERRGVILDLDKGEQDTVTFEKGIRGAVADTLGRAFVVLHSRVELPIPAGSTPLDPEYIERSWAISLLDVASGANRLILTSHEAGRSALWSDEDGLVKLYLGFKVPSLDYQRVETQKDILVANLSTFATKTFRLASYPEGLGIVGPARRVYISQIHPQGRMTFVNVETDERQTVTGYQLNSGID
jgi:YVTN family beta-propeller protein